MRGFKPDPWVAFMLCQSFECCLPLDVHTFHHRPRFVHKSEMIIRASISERPWMGNTFSNAMQCMPQEGQWRCFWFDSESFQFPCRSASSFAAMSAGSITEPPSALEGESIPVHRDFCGCSFPAEIPAMLPAWRYQDASFQPFACSFEDSKATKRLLQQRDVIWIFTW